MNTIPFMKHYLLENFLFGIAGSLIGFMVWLSPRVQHFFLEWKMSTYYETLFFGGVGFFLLTAWICSVAGQSRHESARLAGRRGLFTFCTMCGVILAALVFSGMITWHQYFQDFLRLFLGAIIFVSFFAVPADYGIGLVMQLIKKHKGTDK